VTAVSHSAMRRLDLTTPEQQAGFGKPGAEGGLPPVRRAQEEAVMTAVHHHVDFWTWLSRHWLDIVIVIFFFGSAIAAFFTEFFQLLFEPFRAVSKQRHQQRLDLHRAELELRKADLKLQAALNRQTLRPAPGPCRHRRVSPVVSRDDEVVAWVCRNPDCLAQLPKRTCGSSPPQLPRPVS
jgi:hypothetical protein